VESKAKPMEMASSFLDALGDNLKRKDGVDVNLANILKTHILTAAPAQDAVAKAKAAILSLASERANPAEREPSDG
jgi:hypothetical protein